jgi:hypothetical protein
VKLLKEQGRLRAQHSVWILLCNPITAEFSTKETVVFPIVPSDELTRARFEPKSTSLVIKLAISTCRATTAGGLRPRFGGLEYAQNGY